MLLLIILLIYVQKNNEMMKFFVTHVLFVVKTNRILFIIQTACFILFIGLDRKSFDNKHVTFEDHIRKVHNMWNYVYFMVLINVKDPTEYTGPESYVHEMIEVRCFLIKKENNRFENFLLATKS